MDKVFVVGSVNQDFVLKVSRRPGLGETVTDADLFSHPGGKGANQAVAAALLGARVTMLGRVGGDPFGKALLRNLQDKGVDTSCVEVFADAQTGAAFVTLTPDGENAIIVAGGANSLLTPEDVEDASEGIASADILVVQMEISTATVVRALAVANAGGTRAILNLAPASKLPRSVLRMVDTLVVNEHEASVLLQRPVDGGARGGLGAVAELMTLGPHSVVVTLGANGAVVATEDQTEHYPAPMVPVIDTTGAGDAFVGALARRLAGDDRLKDAVAYAVRAASAAVTREGAQAALPTPEALQPLL